MGLQKFRDTVKTNILVAIKSCEILKKFMTLNSCGWTSVPEVCAQIVHCAQEISEAGIVWESLPAQIIHSNTFHVLW